MSEPEVSKPLEVRHVILSEWRNGNAVHRCTRCNAECVVLFPIVAVEWVAQVQRFKELHVDCPPPWRSKKAV